MAELFIELFSEEMPSKLQIDAREKILKMINDALYKKDISFKSSKSFSTPQRLVFLIDGIPEKKEQNKKTIKGPKTGAPKEAIEGFIKSNNLTRNDLYKKKIEKGEFYFAETKPKIIDVLSELKIIIPEALKLYSWKKSMKWSIYELNWGRPLKSITALFNKNLINFNFFHLRSGNQIQIEGSKENIFKKVSNFQSYQLLLKSQNIVLDQEKRKEIIIKKMENICKAKNFKNKFDQRLIEDVVNLVEKPNVIIGKFDEAYLKIPQEILIITMQQHQKYFPLFDFNDKLTNVFLLVANLPDQKGYIKLGNQRVVEARLSDAKFFWEKNKNQSLVKQVSKLKYLSFFKDLGNFFDKTQRLRKISSLVSDQLNISKEKVEIASSICKADLVSDLVGEYPELQGVMGKYFAQNQGFEQDVSSAVSDHYLPLGFNSEIPKKPISIAVAIIDKVDTLVGFFGINEKPTSSKDPFALRRIALGIIRILIENRKDLKINDLLIYSSSLFQDQGFDLENKNLLKELNEFLKDRFKYYLKEKEIRYDIIDATVSSLSLNRLFSSYEKARCLNKVINNQIGINITSSFKRASNILETEMKNNQIEIDNTTDPGIFKTDYEKNLYKKVNEIKKYYSSIDNNENYEKSLSILADARKEVFEFFDNVKVNEENETLRKNRLELINMLCKTFQNFINFELLKASNE